MADLNVYWLPGNPAAKALIIQTGFAREELVFGNCRAHRRIQSSDTDQAR